MNGFLLVIIIVLFTSFNPTKTANKKMPEKMRISQQAYSEVEAMYHRMQLASTLNFKAFEQAMAGYTQLADTDKGIITVIDFTLPSTEKRMYVIDVENEKLLYHTLVSHGRNSGENYATSFSNENDSHQSSLGFFRTENTYFGGNGYSLVLEGLEQGINDRAKERAVVIHGAPYCSTRVIASTGRLGRSYGCPALPVELAKPIINTIKEGTLLYIYADNAQYAYQSAILKRHHATLLAQRSMDERAESNIF